MSDIIYGLKVGLSVGILMIMFCLLIGIIVNKLLELFLIGIGMEIIFGLYGAIFSYAINNIW